MSMLDLEQIVDMDALEEDLRLTHFVTPADNPEVWRSCSLNLGIPHSDVTGRDIVAYARAENYEVKALCGYVWIPKHDITKYDTCGVCLDIAHKRMAE